MTLRRLSIRGWVGSPEDIDVVVPMAVGHFLAPLSKPISIQTPRNTIDRLAVDAIALQGPFRNTCLGRPIVVMIELQTRPLIMMAKFRDRLNDGRSRVSEAQVCVSFDRNVDAGSDAE